MVSLCLNSIGVLSSKQSLLHFSVLQSLSLPTRKRVGRECLGHFCYYLSVIVQFGYVIPNKQEPFRVTSPAVLVGTWERDEQTQQLPSGEMDDVSYHGLARDSPAVVILLQKQERGLEKISWQTMLRNTDLLRFLLQRGKPTEALLLFKQLYSIHAHPVCILFHLSRRRTRKKERTYRYTKPAFASWEERDKVRQEKEQQQKTKLAE